MFKDFKVEKALKKNLWILSMKSKQFNRKLYLYLMIILAQLYIKYSAYTVFAHCLGFMKPIFFTQFDNSLKKFSLNDLSNLKEKFKNGTYKAFAYCPNLSKYLILKFGD